MEPGKNYLLVNADIYTVNPHMPRASAIAISHGRIVAVGSDSDMDTIRLPGAERIDMHGAFVLPGLVDAHLHLSHTGFAMSRVSLVGASSEAQAIDRVRERAAATPKGAWVQGWGWLQDDWTPSAFPTARALDAATSDHPVALSAGSGHALWANSAAMRLAGIDANTPNPPGGEIVRDAQGNATGVFLETADRLIRRVIPNATQAQNEQAVVNAMRAMNAAGLTGVHCMDGDGGIDTFRTYQRVRAGGQSTLRVTKMLPVQALDEVIGSGLRSGFGDPWLRVGAIKIFTDGALGPKTAWMCDPYEGDASNTGIPIYAPEQLADFTRRAHGAGLAVSVHAIGDRANHEMLNAIEASRAAGAPMLRDRMEHAQVLAPGDIERMARLEVIASMQPIHCTQDMRVADANWGPARTPRAYAWRSLWDAGARLALGSDAPVESFDPLLGIYAAVTRIRPGSDYAAPDGWHPEQRLNIDEALYGLPWARPMPAMPSTSLARSRPASWPI